MFRVARPHVCSLLSLESFAIIQDRHALQTCIEQLNENKLNSSQDSDDDTHDTTVPRAFDQEQHGDTHY